MTLGSRSLLLIMTAAALCFSDCPADSLDKAKLVERMGGYISAARNQADRKKAPVRTALPAWSHGQDPIWYEGNNLGAQELFKDFVVNLFHDFPAGFLDCFDFQSEGSCYKRILGVRIPVGFNVSYRWPIQQILSHRFFQHRYIPEVMFQFLKASKIYENVFYPAVQYGHAPLALTHASLQSAYRMNTKSWIPYIPFHGPILPKIVTRSSSFPLDEPNERGRYDGGKIGNLDLNQLEYSLGPTLMQTAWAVVVNYFPILKILPCTPPEQIPPPLSTHDPAFIDLGRNPFLGLALYKDTELREDLGNWILNPAACQEWMMNKQRSNIPHDMYKPQEFDLIKNPNLFVFLPPILKPMPDSKLSKFDRMCTNNWGGSIPFTTVHQVHDTGFIDAGKNLLKATRLGFGIDKTFLEGTSASQYVKYYPFDKEQDAYQLTYKDEWSCKSVGTPSKPFANSDTLHEPAEHGLYSITHWMRLRSCCMSFSDYFEFIGELGS